jgi:ribonuclease HI
MQPSQHDVIIYTDGGCRGNPGIGAWAYILIDPRDGKAIERAGAEDPTTNNRMELSAVLFALRSLKRDGLRVLICSDSQYTIKSCSQWLPGWKANGWKRKTGALKNVDLMQAIDQELVRHQPTWKWVKGHAGDPGNEHVDTLLNRAMDARATGATGGHEAKIQWQAALPA